jgi:ribosomal protein L11 methyltransferase
MRLNARSVLCFRIDLPEAALEQAAAALWELGTLGLEEQPCPRTGRTTVLAYFPATSGLGARLRGALRPVGGGAPRSVPVPEVDWLARFREGVQPLRAGPFRIVPAWAVPPRPGPLTLVVDPGRAFGTGSHESTRLCLRAVGRLARRGPLGDVLDVGTGSGLLAVAGCRLGARRVVGIDLDPDAVASARRHAALNGVDVHLVLGDLAEPMAPFSFDLVLANLTAETLRARLTSLACTCRPGGRLVLSGFLRSDVASLRACFGSAGRSRVSTEGEWAALEIARASA